jgi:hypothetical protein
MTDRDVNIKALLWASIEDYCGLWELVWELNTLHPNNSSQENQRIALRYVLYFLSKDLVKLFYCQEPYGRLTEVVGIDSYVDFLQESNIWAPPLPGTRSVRVSATGAGEKYYKNIMAPKKHE